MKMRRLILIIAILIFPVVTLIAGGSSEATSEESWIIAHSNVDNDNMYWDVTKTITPAVPAAEYSPTSENGLFRMRTNYGRNYTDEKYRKVTITPDANGWYMVSDNNITLKRQYTVEIYQIKWTRSSSSSPATVSGNPTKVTPSTSNASEISFTMQAATWDREGNWFFGYTYYSSVFYDYEVVIKLPALSEQELAVLEPGAYHATFNVTMYLGSDGGSSQTETYTIKGMFGESSSSNTEYSFMIDSATYTYSVDLSETDSYFDVANIQFHASATNTSNSSQTQMENNFKNKFSVVISPYNDYTLDSTSNENPYAFILNGTENLVRNEINTVPYTIHKNGTGGTFSLYDSNKYKHTYKVTPTLIVSGKSRDWVLNWDLSQLLYVKPTAPTDETISRAAGFYKTTIYFYIVTNT